MAEKVLFVSPQPWFQWRGSPIRVAFNVQALAELGFEVDLLTLPFGDDKEIPGVRLIRAPNLFLQRNIPIGPSFWKAMFDIVLLFMALGLAFKNRYSVIHGIEDAGLIAIIAGRLTGAKVIYEKHSDPLSYKKPGIRSYAMRVYAKLEKFMARHADSIIGTGPGLVEQARAAARPETPVYHIFDIPSSLVDADEKSVEELSRKLRRSGDEILVTYVGSFAVYQGVDLMFDSIPPVIEKCPNVRFVVIGGSDDEIKERRASMGKQGCADHIEFAGKVAPDELPAYLKASDILLSPRISGVNTPLKLLDYLKAGRPIVATELSCNRQILDDSCAVFAEPTAQCFAEAITALAKNAELRAEIGACGRKKVDELYNFEEFKKRLGICYGQ